MYCAIQIFKISHYSHSSTNFKTDIKYHDLQPVEMERLIEALADWYYKNICSVYRCIGNPLNLAPTCQPSAATVLSFSRNPCATHCAVAVFVIHDKNQCYASLRAGCSRWLAVTALAWTSPAKLYMVFALTWLLVLYPVFMFLSGVFFFPFVFLLLMHP